MSAITVSQRSLLGKLQILAAIWEDLRERATQFDISRAQKELLDARRIRVKGRVQNS